MIERRQDPRIPGVFEAKWHAQSGAAQGRLTDLSWHGCFVDVANTPSVGDDALITATINGTSVKLHGQVRHVWPRIGFGMEIDPKWPMTEPERSAMRSLLNPEPSLVWRD